MSLTSKIIAQVIATEKGAIDLGSTKADISASALLDLASGVGSSQADLVWSDERTLVASASENLDLAGALVGALGNTLAFSKVKAILVIAAAANTNDVVVGNAASNGFVGPFGAATHTIAVKPGGVALLACPGTGWSVTAATADLLKVANGGAGTPVTYKVVIIGTSA